MGPINYITGLELITKSVPLSQTLLLLMCQGTLNNYLYKPEIVY